MANKINRERLKAFLLRRKLNAMGLLVITAFSLIITIICALCSFPRTGILAFVTALLVLLCFIQAFRMRSSYRTIRAFKGSRKKKNHTN